MSDKIRILLVDDNEGNRTAVALLLSRKGFDVIEAADGRIALNVLTDELHDKPDVIILDLRMPVMDGFEFLRVYPGPVPVVVWSAYADYHELPREPYAVIIKPESVVDCESLLRQAADTYRTETRT